MQKIKIRTILNYYYLVYYILTTKINPMKKHISCKKNWVLIILLLALLTTFDSCKKASEKKTEKMIEKSIGNDATVDLDKEKISIETEEGKFTSDVSAKEWPTEIPKDVPIFTDGKVTAVTSQEMEDSNNWVIIFGEIPKNALENYKTKLKGEGYTIVFSTSMGTGGHVAAEKGDYKIMIMETDGNATVSVDVKK